LKGGKKDMREEKVLHDATLCLLINPDNEVSLAVKADKIGKGCRNGYGGGIEPGETPRIAAVRETLHEAEVIVLPEDLGKIGIMYFYNTKTDGSIFVCKMHVFIARRWEGNPKETREMLDPQWFSADVLPIDKMMPADTFWMPLVLKGKKIIGIFHYAPFQKKLIADPIIEEVDFVPEY